MKEYHWLKTKHSQSCGEKNGVSHIIVATPNKLIGVLVLEVELGIPLAITDTPPKVDPPIGSKIVSAIKDYGR